MKPCKNCGKKLGLFYVVGNFCSFGCRSTWKLLRKQGDNK